MMPGKFGGYGALVTFVIVTVGVIMVIGSMGCMGLLIVMRMRHGFTHAAMGQHQAEDQNHAEHSEHSPMLAERQTGANDASASFKSRRPRRSI